MEIGDLRKMRMFSDLVVKDTKVRPGTGRSEKVKLTHSYPQEPVNKMFLKILQIKLKGLSE